MKIITMNQAELQKIDLSDLHKAVAVISVNQVYNEKQYYPSIRRVLQLNSDKIDTDALNKFIQWSKKTLLDEIWVCSNDTKINLYISKLLSETIK